MTDLRSVAIPLPCPARISPYESIAEDRVRRWARRHWLSVTLAATQRRGLQSRCRDMTDQPAGAARRPANGVPTGSSESGGADGESC